MTKVNRDHIWMFFEHGIDISTKTLYLGYGADDEMDLDQKATADVLKGLHVLSNIRPEEPIRILLNNTGGDTQHGLAIYDAIHNVTSPVHITVYGHCYSIGAWILQAADKRIMSKHSSLMIHDGDSVVSGKKEEFKNWHKFYEEQDHRCREILLERIREVQPGYTLRQVEKMLKTDTVMWPAQALALGLIDEIIE